MYKLIFNRVQRIIPKISQTELIALRSGGTSIDKNIFWGNVNRTNFKTENNSPERDARFYDLESQKLIIYFLKLVVSLFIPIMILTKHILYYLKQECLN